MSGSLQQPFDDSEVMDTPRYTSPRQGRPRHTPTKSPLLPREEILGAAARLFTGQGFAATSTREIADEVGIRQASLYYHFAGKDDILGELLEMTVRPTLDSLDDLAEIVGDDARLYCLAARDAQVLAGLMHNIGLLPTLPDVSKSPAFETHETARLQLSAAYAALGIACASDAVLSTVSKKQLGGMILQQVEGVVRTRAAGQAVVTVGELHAIAATCLRICGVSEDRAKAAARTCVL